MSSHARLSESWLILSLVRPMYHSVRLIFAAAVAAMCTGCSFVETPTVISQQQLTFLEHQQRPLWLTDVQRHLGTTGFGPNGLCYSYTVRETKHRVEFWMYPPPDEPRPDLKTGDPIPIEIKEVIERASEADENPRVIWSPGLKEA